MGELNRPDGLGRSVTQRVKAVKQPRGGYIKPKAFTPNALGDGLDALNPEENVSANMVGLVVDYMTRVMSGTPADEAFKVALVGANQLYLAWSSGRLRFAGDVDAQLEFNGEMSTVPTTAEALAADIKGLDDASIIAAVRLARYDTVYRAGLQAYLMGWRPCAAADPDAPTIANIRTMVERALAFFDVYGPKALSGFTFEGGYTTTVATGDGDFTTEDTLWDFKTSKLPIKKEHTLQLLMYWRMGLRSAHPEFQNVKYLGIYNPRTNVASRLAVADIPADVIEEVEHDVIGYVD